MGADGNLDWRNGADWLGTAASALEWWQDAGVDMLVEEAPRDWFAQTVAPVPVAVAAPAVAAAVPGDAAGFLAWRTGPDAPEAAWRGPLLPAVGPIDARVMVLVDCPDREDGDGGLLTGGAAGRLFERMLAAIGLCRDTVHLAATYWRRPPPGRMAREVEDRLAELARRHVALVAPKRLLLLGDAASRALVGTNIIPARDGLRQLHHDGTRTEAVASFHPRLLLDRPAVKAEAWKDLQALVQGLDVGDD